MSFSAALGRRRPAPGALPAEAPAPRFRLQAPWQNRRLAFAVVMLAAALVYVGSLWNGFAYDDVAIISLDARITKFQLWRILGESYWINNPALAIYRPLTSLSFAVDWVISRGYPSFFHAVNLLEHVGVSALVLALLLELFTPAGAFLGALVFALHPVHVEAVANVVGRAEVLSALFYLGAVLVWIRGGSVSSARRVLAITLLYLLALFAKESSATLPAALVLMDFALARWRLQGPSLRAYARRALPLLATLAVVLAGFVWLRFHVLGRLSPSIVDPIFDLDPPAGARVMTALQAWPIYARLLFYPRTLLADYGPRVLMPIAGWNALALSGLGILLFLLVGGLDALRRGAGRTALGLLWFIVTVLPVSNLMFPIGIIVAERTLYLPMLALCFGAAAAAERAPAWRPRLRYAFAGGCGLVLVLFALRTATRVPAWDSTNSIFYRLEADAPQSFRAAWHLARVARSAKNTQLSVRRYEKALRLWPYRRALTLEAAREEVGAGRKERARALAAFAARRWPGDISAQKLLATISLDVGDTAAARLATRAGLQLDPKDTTLLRLSRTLSGGGQR